MNEPRARSRLSVTWRIAAALVFGIVMTFATAFIAAWYGPIGPVTSMSEVTYVVGTKVYLPLAWPWTMPTSWGGPTHVEQSSAWGMRWKGMSHIGVFVDAGNQEELDTASALGLGPVEVDPAGSRGFDPDYFCCVQEFRAGWPITALRWWRESPPQGTDAGTLATTFTEDRWWSGGVELGPQQQWIGYVYNMTSRRMPVRPIWPLFLANVAIWGAMMWCAWAGVAWVVHGRRIASRRRNGLCLRCGYSVAGLENCPECGEAASPE